MINEKSSPVCSELEKDLSAFVDGELRDIHADRLVKHLDACPHCQELIEQMKTYARWHKDCFDPEAVMNSIDPSRMFQNITSELLEEKIQNIARLFYQIGKSYLSKGFSMKSLPGARHSSGRVHHIMKSKPMPLGRAKQKAGHLFREVSSLCKTSRQQNKQIQRARTFYKSVRVQTDAHLEMGRRFMEESLAIDPSCAEPRLFLGCYYFAGVRKYNQARDQFRKVLTMTGLSEENRTEALMNLGITFNIECRYEEALACFREVAKSRVIEKHPRFFRCFIFQAITYAKLGKYKRSISAFDTTVKGYPERIDEIRKTLWDMNSFQSVIKSQPAFRRSLREKIPAIFASQAQG